LACHVGGPGCHNEGVLGRAWHKAKADHSAKFNRLTAKVTHTSN